MIVLKATVHTFDNELNATEQYNIDINLPYYHRPRPWSRYKISTLVSCRQVQTVWRLGDQNGAVHHVVHIIGPRRDVNGAVTCALHWQKIQRIEFLKFKWVTTSAANPIAETITNLAARLFLFISVQTWNLNALNHSNERNWQQTCTYRPLLSKSQIDAYHQKETIEHFNAQRDVSGLRRLDK